MVVRKDDATGVDLVGYTKLCLVILLRCSSRDGDLEGASWVRAELDAEWGVKYLEIGQRELSASNVVVNLLLPICSQPCDSEYRILVGTGITETQTTLVPRLVEAGTVWMFASVSKMLLEGFRVAKDLPAVATEGKGKG